MVLPACLVRFYKNLTINILKTIRAKRLTFYTNCFLESSMKCPEFEKHQWQCGKSCEIDVEWLGRVQGQAGSITEWGVAWRVRAERLCVRARHKQLQLTKHDFVLSTFGDITFDLTRAALYAHCESDIYMNKKYISCFIRIFWNLPLMKLYSDIDNTSIFFFELLLGLTKSKGAFLPATDHLIYFCNGLGQ